VKNEGKDIVSEGKDIVKNIKSLFQGTKSQYFIPLKALKGSFLFKEFYF